MKALRDYVSFFSGHSLWARYFQIFLDIVSGQDIFRFLGTYVRSGPAPFLMMIMIGLDYLTSPYDPRQERGTLLSEFSGSVGIDPWGGFEGVW